MEPRKRPFHGVTPDLRVIPLSHVRESLVIAVPPDDFRRPERVKRVRHPRVLVVRAATVAVSEDRAPLLTPSVDGEMTAHQPGACQRPGVEEDQDRGRSQPRAGIPRRPGAEPLVLLKVIFQPQSPGKRRYDIRGTIG